MSERAYPARPLVGVGVVLFKADHVLLVRRARPPLLGSLSFPGGAQELGETVEEAARRELREETGLEAGPLRLAAHVDVIDRDGDGRVRFHYTVLDLTGEWISGELRPGGDVSEALFVPLERLEAAGLDGPHRRVVRLARPPA
jgi:ADP-ribose pyrophosphatase YjhB (NUDIX family)